MQAIIKPPDANEMAENETMIGTVTEAVKMLNHPHYEESTVEGQTIRVTDEPDELRFLLRKVETWAATRLKEIK